MHDTAFETLSPGRQDLAEKERIVRSAEKKSPARAAILAMIAVNILLWVAMYWGVQSFF